MCSLWMDSIKRSRSNAIKREDILNEEKVMWYFNDEEEFSISDITIRIENGQQIVDVEGDFVFKFDSCTGGKLPFKFGKVTGHFICSGNDLTTLEGCPKTVGGDFSCMDNNLTSLKGCPETVGGDFICSCNNLSSIKGRPKEVGGDFICSNNNFTFLKDFPEKVCGNFSCSNNKLTSLEGCPKEVGGDFYCRNNHLTPGVCPCKVNGNIYSDNNIIKKNDDDYLDKLMDIMFGDNDPLVDLILNI